MSICPHKHKSNWSVLLLFNSLCFTERVTSEQGETMPLGAYQALLWENVKNTMLL